MVLRFAFLLCCIGALSPLWAQEKIERESRLSSSEVPEQARLCLARIDSQTRIKWYREEGLTGMSIEAKFSWQKHRYSVEFDSLGSLQDIEIELSWKELDKALQDSLHHQLEQECNRHKVRKIQLQYTGDTSDLKQFLLSDSASPKLSTHYELVVKCRTDGRYYLYEFLFSEAAVLQSKLKIVFRDSSHLEY
ncbi:MAG: hypothetical protein EP332_10225 [Bacteroidetes bacterium]|nr:MAG: hypothetical protein EP332_10225 [Bacteroidota bacterium]